MLQRFKLGTKLTLVVAVAIVGLLLATAVSYATLQQVRIDSPRYRAILQTEELVADVLPPPAFILEPYLIVQQAATTESSVEVAELVNRLRFARTEYFESHDRWSAALTSSAVADIRKALVEDAHAAAVEFWKVVDEKFIPAVERGDTATAAALSATQLADSFRTHRIAIDRAVSLSTQRRADLEASNNRYVRNATIVLVAFIGLLIVLIAALSGALIRSIRRPLQRLTSAARRTAETDLPLVVAHFESSDDELDYALAPIAAGDGDEIGELSVALSSLRSAAVDLAVRQATARRNVNEMFINLGRRNASLINRQLSFIDGLERTEEDPQTLEELYRLDHLATRLRRNAESLLVLAGSDAARRQGANAEVIDCLRASLSEIEDYQQVELHDVEPALLKSQAVADVIHLFAELIENATAFSPPTRPVVVTGRRVNEGFVVSVIDEGIGMSPEQLAEANRRIELLDHFDVSPSKVLGLYVVGRLAARHGIGVRLIDSPTQGVTARVMIPRLLLADAEHAAPLAPTGLAADRGSVSFDQPPAMTVPAAPQAPAPPQPPGASPRSFEFRPLEAAPAASAAPVVPPPPAPPRPVQPMPLGLPSADAAAREPFYEAPRTRRIPMAPMAPPTRPASAQPAVAAPAAPKLEQTPPPAAPKLEQTPPWPGLPTRAGDLAIAPPHELGSVPLATPAPPVANRGGDAAGLDPANPGLVRRVRGAQLPDVGAGRETFDPEERDAGEVRAMISRFYGGVQAGLSDRGLAQPSALGGTSATIPDAAPSAADPARPAPLVRRVRGAQLPETGGRTFDDDAQGRSPDAVRSMLDRFRLGVDRGRDTAPGADRYTETTEES